MKKIIVTFISISLLLIGFSGCTTTENSSQNNQDMNYQSPENNFEISASSAYEKLQNNQSIKLIDVRTPEEYDEQHLSNSKLIPLDNLVSEISNVENLNKSDEIIVYCRSGRRSEAAYNLLTSQGYTNVKSMAGGINEWTSLGYSVCKDKNITC